MAKKKNNVRVSVIIPAYNAQEYIADAIESILTQTFEDIEIIIVDDASTDETARVALGYAAKDDRIRLYTNKVNLGIGANRTKGIKLAFGEYICWQDADDVSLPDRIDQQVKYLDTHLRVGIVGGFIQFFDENGNGPIREYSENDTDLRKTIFRYNPVAQPASMARRECYDEVGGYDGSLTTSEDLEMLFRIGSQYEFANVQNVVLRYRQSASSLTRANLKRMELVTLALRRRYAKSPSYHFTLVDALFNGVQYISLWIMPTGVRMWLFAIIRGDK